MAYMLIIMLTAIIGVSPQFSRNSKQGFGLFAIGILTFLMALVPFQSADFIHVAYSFQKNILIYHFEDIYIWIYNLDQSIWLWRILVFGPTTLLLIWIIKLLGVNSKFASFIFVITQMFMFGALRNMFGLMLMFFSIATIFYKARAHKRLFWILLGVLGLFGCTFLHRSMILYVMLLGIALIPFETKTVKISLVVFPFLYGSIFILSNWFIMTFLPEMAEHAEYYTGEERGTTLMKTINEVLKHGAYLYLLFIIYRTYGNSSVNFPIAIKFLLRYAFVLIYLGFLFCGQGTGGWLFERFVWTGDIALMFVMMWFFYIYPRTFGVKVCFGILIYQILYQMMYICTRANDQFVERYNTIQL